MGHVPRRASRGPTPAGRPTGLVGKYSGPRARKSLYHHKDPEVVFWPSVFWRPGVRRPKNHTCSRNAWLFGLAAEGGKAKKPLFSFKYVICWPRCPRPPKKHLAKKTLRDPSDVKPVGADPGRATDRSGGKYPGPGTRGVGEFL